MLLVTASRAEEDTVLRAELVVPSYRPFGDLSETVSERALPVVPPPPEMARDDVLAPENGSAPPIADPGEAVEVPLNEREAPPSMVIDDLGLLEQASRQRLEAVLVGLRESDGIHLYAVATDAIDADGRETLASISARWSGDADIHGVVLLSSDMTFPMAKLGGRATDAEKGGYIVRVLADAMTRGRCYRLRGDVFRGCAREVAEEMQILRNRYAYARAQAAEQGAEPQRASQAANGAVAPKSPVLVEGDRESSAFFWKELKAAGTGRPLLKWALILCVGGVLVVLPVRVVLARRRGRRRGGVNHRRAGRARQAGAGQLPMSPASVSAPDFDGASPMYFPDLEVGVRFRSPYAGGNDIVVQLLASGGAGGGASQDQAEEEDDGFVY